MDHESTILTYMNGSLEIAPLDFIFQLFEAVSAILYILLNERLCDVNVLNLINEGFFSVNVLVKSI